MCFLINYFYYYR